MRKSYIKYGVYTLTAWNLFFFLLFILSVNFYNDKLIENSFGSLQDIFVFILLNTIWSFIWFLIGYSERKRFVLERVLYRDLYPTLDSKIVDRLYRISYIEKWLKTLTIVTLVGIPFYAIVHLEDSYSTLDYIALFTLSALSILFYCCHKILRFLKRDKK